MLTTLSATSGELTLAPAADVLRRHAVGEAAVAALRAFELRLGASVLLVDVPALRALARGIARVDENDGHTGAFGLVADEQSQLVEGPASQAAAQRAVEPCPPADAREVLKGRSEERRVGKECR